MRLLLLFVSFLFLMTTNSFATCSSNNAYGVNPCSPSYSDSERRFKMKIWQQQRREKQDKFFQERRESVRSKLHNWRNN